MGFKRTDGIGGVDLNKVDYNIRRKMEQNPGWTLQQAQDAAADDNRQRRGETAVQFSLRHAAASSGGGGGQQAQPSSYGGGSGAALPGRRDIELERGRDAESASRFRREESELSSRLRREEMGYGSDLARRESLRREGALKGLIGDVSGGGVPRVEYEGAIGSDETAARAAAFARAKEQAGQTARASLSALEDVSAERGLMNSTLEAGETGRVIGGARADIQDFTREQLLQDLDRSREVANMRYTGGIQQRGQELNRQQALLGLLAGKLY